MPPDAGDQYVDVLKHATSVPGEGAAYYANSFAFDAIGRLWVAQTRPEGASIARYDSGATTPTASSMSFRAARFFSVASSAPMACCTSPTPGPVRSSGSTSATQSETRAIHHRWLRQLHAISTSARTGTSSSPTVAGRIYRSRTHRSGHSRRPPSRPASRRR